MGLLALAQNAVGVSRELWQPNNNSAYSAAGLGANRLTLRTNWGQIAPVDRVLRIFRAGAFAFGNGLDALLIAAFAGTKNQDRPRARAAGRDRVRSHRHHVRRAGAIADADTHSDTHPFTDPQSDADGDQFDGVVGRGGDQSRQQFPGAAGQPVEQRLQSPAADQSRRRRRLREHGSAALPDLVRRLRQLYEERRGRRFRRRYQKDLGWRGRDRRAGGAGHQYRLLGRPEPLRDRYSAGAAIGDDRPDPDRFHGLRRQRAVDLGQRGGARFRQHQFAPRHRAWNCDRRIQCASSTAS